MSWRETLLSLVTRGRAQPATGWDPAALRATPPLCIVGDLHGRMDLLEQMLSLIAARPGAGDVRRIFVGDMIDRGPDSLAVLRRLYRLCLEETDTTICLMGNHERMMLDFLADPERHGPRWIAAGGAETLAEAGIVPWGRTPLPALASQLRAALGPDMTGWLEALPLYWQEGPGLGVTHAGAAPDLDLAEQPQARLLWGAAGATVRPRRDGMWIAQGHEIVASVRLAGGRIMLDTGAWRSGILSAVWIDADGPRVLRAVQQGMRPDDTTTPAPQSGLPTS